MTIETLYHYIIIRSVAKPIGYDEIKRGEGIDNRYRVNIKEDQWNELQDSLKEYNDSNEENIFDYIKILNIGTFEFVKSDKFNITLINE